MNHPDRENLSGDERANLQIIQMSNTLNIAFEHSVVAFRKLGIALARMAEYQEAKEEGSDNVQTHK